MFRLAPYFAGGLAALVAMDFAPPVKSVIDEWTGVSASAATVQVVNKVDRSRKGDRLVPLRASSGRFGTTSIIVPAAAVGSNSGTAAKSAPSQPAKPATQGAKMPIGCDPAFSPLAASASLNFAGRCLS